MNKVQHLLGYYRDNDLKISPVFSDTREFLDISTTYQNYEAIIMPIIFKSIESDWGIVPLDYALDPILKYIFDHQLHFITHHSFTNESEIMGTKLAVLMHAPSKVNEMCRTGVLIKYVDDAWKPVTILYDQMEFIVECKGVGSGIGGFPALHSRLQAGSGNYHCRVTGGMSFSSMEKEFSSLIRMAQFSEYNGLLPLAAIGYQYQSEDLCQDMGLLLRLSPSNIRYSYRKFGNFTVNNNTRAGAFKYIPKRMQTLHKLGFRHANVNSNNLLYVSEDDYTLTDYEELDSVLSAPASLDKEALDLPLYLSLYPFRYIYTDPYFENGDFEKYKVKLSKTVAQHSGYEAEILSFFSSSNVILEEYFQLSVFFVGEEYFKLPLVDWLETVLDPILLKQQDILEIISQHNYSSNITMDEYNQLIQEHLVVPDNQIKIGDFYSLNSIVSHFLFPYTHSQVVLNMRIKQIMSIRRQIKRVLYDQQPIHIFNTYKTPFIYIPKIVGYKDLFLFMFPFISWVTHWADFLDTYFCLNQENSVNVLHQKIQSELTEPRVLYELFSKKDKDGFIEFLTHHS